MDICAKFNYVALNNLVSILFTRCDAWSDGHTDRKEPNF